MPTTFYIFHGDDDLRIEEEVQKIRDKMGHTPDAEMNIAEFDGTADVNEILNAANSYPFLADKRLVIVKEMLTWITRKGAGNTGKKAVELLLETLPKLPDWTRLVFVEAQKLADSNKVLQLARQAGGNGLEKAYSAPKDSTGWIVKRAQEEYGTHLDAQVAAALSSVTGSDLRRADNELVKLISYVDGTRPITEADVALLTPYVAEASMFEMVDALAEGRGKAAAMLIRRLLEQEEDIFSLYGMIVRQFRLLLLAKEHLTSGGVPGSIAKEIGVHPYVAEKLAKQTRSFTLPQLEQIFRRLQEYDLQMKTGRIEPILALDLLIAGLSTR